MSSTMSKLTVTNFSNRTGSPFKSMQDAKDDVIVHEEVLQKTSYDALKEKNSELLLKVNRKTAEYQAHKPSSGVFTEVVTHGAFTSKKLETEPKLHTTDSSQTLQKTNNGIGNKSLLGYPSSANDLALDAKSDLESDPNISKEIKEKVIGKLFALVSMVQHTYESKVRIMTEYDKFKDTHLKNEIRRERDHCEQLYKLNMNFQNEVLQSVQQLRSELDFTRNITNDSGETCDVSVRDPITANDDERIESVADASSNRDVTCQEDS